MKKMDVILDAVVEVITHVRAISDSLQKVVDVLGTEVNTTPAIEEKEKTVTKTAKKTKKYSLEDVRGILAEKSQTGFSAEVKELISKFGADRLSAVDPAKYEELIKEAEEIGNE